MQTMLKIKLHALTPRLDNHNLTRINTIVVGIPTQAKSAIIPQIKRSIRT